MLSPFACPLPSVLHLDSREPQLGAEIWRWWERHREGKKGLKVTQQIRNRDPPQPGLKERIREIRCEKKAERQDWR